MASPARASLENGDFLESHVIAHFCNRKSIIIFGFLGVIRHFWGARRWNAGVWRMGGPENFERHAKKKERIAAHSLRLKTMALLEWMGVTMGALNCCEPVFYTSTPGDNSKGAPKNSSANRRHPILAFGPPQARWFSPAATAAARVSTPNAKLQTPNSKVPRRWVSGSALKTHAVEGCWRFAVGFSVGGETHAVVCLDCLLDCR